MSKKECMYQYVIHVEFSDSTESNICRYLSKNQGRWILYQIKSFKTTHMWGVVVEQLNTTRKLEVKYLLFSL